MATDRVIELELALEKRFQTDGSINDLYFYIEAPDLKGIGAHTEDVQVRWATTAFTTDFEFRIEAFYSNDGGETWTTMGTTALMTDQSSSGQSNGAVFADRTKFGRDFRFAVVVKNTQGTAIESGGISAWAAVKLWS